MLPAGDAITFFFSDIEGSTSRWERDRSAMSAALAQHDVLLRAAIESASGQVFKTVGEAFYAAFAQPLDALNAAIAAQRALVATNWQDFGPEFQAVRVRIGLHRGTAEARGNDYFGPALNRTARLMSAGHGGQILVSEAVRERVAALLPDGVRLRDLGEHRLKDLRHAERISQVVSVELPDVTRALTTAGELGAQDRIVVLDAGQKGEDDAVDARLVVVRSVPETLAALRSVVIGDARSLTVTPAQL